MTPISLIAQTTANPLFLDAQYSNLLKVDGIGYRPNDSKIAHLVNPVQGFNEQRTYTPATTIDVRVRDTDELLGR
jgi:ribosomal protein L6P/L9E